MVWAILFAPQLVMGRLFVIGDTSSIRAFAQLSAARWHALHERTHWNPYIFAGLPATASLQDSRPQWLPDPLLDVFDAVHRLPGFPPLAIPLLVHLAGMIAMAALARELWSARTTSMVWAGLAWGLLPNQLVPLAFGQDWLVMSTSLVPVLLLAVHGAAAAATPLSRFRAGLALALATAALFLAAHPQIILLALPLAGAFALERTWRHRRAAELVEMAGAVALGAAMAAAVWWPAHLYNVYSVRGAGGVSLAEVARWSANALDLASLAWPWAAGFGARTYWGGLGLTDFPQYVGIGVVVLGLWGLARRDANRAAAALLVGAAVLGVLLSLGHRLGPAYQLLYARVPFWSVFRVSIRAIVVAQLALALLSARGLEQLHDVARGASRRVLAGAGAVLAAALLVALALRVGPLAEAYAQAARDARPGMDAATALATAHHAAVDLGWRGALLAALLASAGFAARAPGKRAGAVGALACLALLALDLGSVSVPFLARATGPRALVEDPPAPLIARLAAREPEARVLDLTRSRLFANDWIRWRARSFTGNHPAVPREWDDIWKAGLPESYPALCVFAIRYLGGVPIAPADSVRFAPAGTEASGAAVWRLRRAPPRAYTVERVTRRADEPAVLAALGAPGLDARREAYTAEDGAAGRYPGSAACRVRWLEDEPDHLALETSADSAAFLVLADTWFPGWRATLDGRACPIHRVQHLLRGFALPPGTHVLRLRYEPEGWTASVRWTWIAWALWLAGLAVAIAPALRRPRPPVLSGAGAS